MQSQYLKLTLAVLVLAIGLAGCGSKRKDAGAENLDSSVEADTASLDAEPSVENTAEEPQPVVEEAKPAEEPAPAAAATEPDPEITTSAGDLGTYTVQPGDTLMKIAFTLYGDIGYWKNLYNWNKDVLTKASKLEKGTQLKYEKPQGEPMVERNGDPYLIKKGDTLASIAYELYAKRSKWKKLWANNRKLIKNPHRIYAGFYLYYQITEQEKQLAEQTKAKNGGGAAADAGATASVTPTGGDPQQPADATTSAAPAADPSASVTPSQPDPSATGASMGGSGGGLRALTRAPASQPAAPAK